MPNFLFIQIEVYIVITTFKESIMHESYLNKKNVHEHKIKNKKTVVYEIF